jgi:hypothetical protein
VQRFADVETTDQYDADKEQAEIKNKLIREMQMDTDKFVPERK